MAGNEGRDLLRAEKLARLGQYAALAILAGASCVQLLPLLSCSYWLDETHTVWMSQASFLDALGLSYRYHGHSPFFLAVLWPWKEVFGSAEWQLRLLPLMSFVVLCGAAFYLGKALASAAAGRAAVAYILFDATLSRYALEVRPYMFSAALSVVALLAAWRLCERCTRINFALFVIFTAAVAYAHYFFIPVLCIQFLLAAGHPSPARSKVKILAPGYLLAGLCCIPLLFHLRHVASSASKRDWVAMPGWKELYQLVASPQLKYLLLFCAVFFLFSLITGRLKFSHRQIFVVSALLLWALLPPLTDLAASRLLGISVHFRRYWIWGIPGAALFFGFVLTALPGKHFAERAALAVMGFLALARLSSFSAVQCNEEWREAVQLAHENGASSYAVRSGHIETRLKPFLEDEEKIAVMSSPVSVYDEKARILSLPYSLTDPADAKEWIKTKLSEFVHETAKICYVTSDLPPWHEDYIPFMAGLFKSLGYQQILERHLTGGMWIYCFSR